MAGLPRSQAQASSPVTTSKARTTPEGSAISRLSATQPPMMILSPTTVGIEVWK